MAEYTPFLGDAIRLDFAEPLNAIPGDAIVLKFGGEPVEVVGTPIRSPGTAIAWGKLRPVDGRVSLPWRSQDPHDRAVRIPCTELPAKDGPHLRAPWKSTVPLAPRDHSVSWQKLNPKGESLRIPWVGLDPLARTYLASWRSQTPHDRAAVRIPWHSGLPIDFEVAVPWRHSPPKDKDIRLPWWAAKPHKDKIWHSYWGRELYARICERLYIPPPGDAIRLDFTELITDVGDRDHITLRFEPMVYDLRCKQREPSGWRDNYIYVPPEKGAYPLSPKDLVLWTMNTASLSRVADAAPIAVSEMDIGTDIDSWCWTFTAKVPEASLVLVMPTEEPVAVRATINGFSWVVLIESWSESHRFGRREYTIRGRSQSALLADPYAPARAGSNRLSTTAQQLAAEELTDTGFALDWDIVDWLVTAGALSYTGSTPLKTIQRIVEVPGGRLQSHRTDKTLIVMPRLHSLPWTWTTATPDLGISDYVVRQLSREYQPGLPINAVFISGENQGIRAKVVRSGSAGDELAQMVADALITDVEPARERGRLIIGQSGKWSKEGLELPLTVEGTLPGLLSVGQLIEMEERGKTWRGQVVGVRVRASMGSFFSVGQSIDVERYYGN